MTSDEKDRLEIAKEVSSFRACTLQEIYNFVKAGKTVTLEATNAIIHLPVSL